MSHKNNKSLRKSLSLAVLATALTVAGFSSAYAEVAATAANNAANAPAQAQAQAAAPAQASAANAAAPAAQGQAQVQANAKSSAPQAQAQANATPRAHAKAAKIAAADIESTNVGIEVAVAKGKLLVVAPVKGSPAAQAGVKTGDVIAKIDNEPVKNMTFAQAIARINGQGNKDEKVSLTLVRKGQAKPVEVSLAREAVKVNQAKNA